MEAFARALVALSAGALSGRHHLDEIARRVEVAAATPRRATYQGPAEHARELARGAADLRRVGVRCARLSSPLASPRSVASRRSTPGTPCCDQPPAQGLRLCRAAAAPPPRSSDDRMGPPQSQKIRQAAAAATATFDPELRACRRRTRAPSQPACSADRSGQHS